MHRRRHRRVLNWQQGHREKPNAAWRCETMMVSPRVFCSSGVPPLARETATSISASSVMACLICNQKNRRRALEGDRVTPIVCLRPQKPSTQRSWLRTWCLVSSSVRRSPSSPCLPVSSVSSSYCFVGNLFIWLMLRSKMSRSDFYEADFCMEQGSECMERQLLSAQNWVEQDVGQMHDVGFIEHYRTTCLVSLVSLQNVSSIIGFFAHRMSWRWEGWGRA